MRLRPFYADTLTWRMPSLWLGRFMLNNNSWPMSSPLRIGKYGGRVTGIPQATTANLHGAVVFEMVERFPMTPAGKIDRKALQKMSARRSGRARLDVPLPRTPTERAVADVWSGILGVENVGVNDDFFDLGGHSLMVVRMLYQINVTLRVKLGVPDLFRNPTVEQLAAVIESRRSKRQRATSSGTVARRGQRSPFVFYVCRN